MRMLGGAALWDFTKAACLQKNTQQKYMQRYKAQDVYMLVINMENSVCQNYNPT